MPRAFSSPHQQPRTPLPLVATHASRQQRQQQRNHGFLGAVKRRLLSQSGHKRGHVSYGAIPGDEMERSSATMLDVVSSSPTTVTHTPQQQLTLPETSGSDGSSSVLVLRHAESHLRFAFGVSMAFFTASRIWGASRILTYLGIAWGTTLLLRGMVYYYRWRAQQRLFVLLEDEERDGGLLLLDDDDDENTTSEDRAVTTNNAHQQFLMIDTSTYARVVPGTLFPLDNDVFSGHFLLLLNTDDDTMNPHFRNKQRRFEFQFQIQVKQPPPVGDTVYFACRVPHPVQFNVVQRMLVNTAMALCRGVVYEPGTRMAFELAAGMDRRIFTPHQDSSIVPTLGQDLPQSNVDAPITEWRTDGVYTFALWSKYVDFLQWECRNLPGVRNFGLASLLGRQPIYLTVEHSNGSSSGTSMVELEVSHQHYTDPGMATQRHWDMTETGDCWSLAQGIYVRSGEWWQLQAEDGCKVAHGGGFCVLNPVASLVCIENRQRSLLQNGDTVTLKTAEGGVTKHLTIHRGWWLKWVSTPPTLNGYFTIHFDNDYLTVGGSFRLQHKRWSGYRVGVASDGSAAYGGRMLGLHEEYDDWIQPLQLCALDPDSSSDVVKQAEGKDGADLESIELVFSDKQHRMDVPAYIEVMNRQTRVVQYVYAVRVSTAGWTRLRTGRDLAKVMQRGYTAMSAASSPRQIPSSNSFDISTGGEQSEDDWELESDDAFEMYDSYDEAVDAVKPEPRKSRKLIGKIARSVKSTTTNAARSTGNAGKLVVSHGVKGTVNAGKATVNAGKAILPIRPKKPPAKEPKSAKRRSSHHRRHKDLRVNVNARSVRRAEAIDICDKREFSPPAGELSAPEQSCRTVSNRVSKMSAEPENSPLSPKISSLLASLVNTREDRDKKFLRGGAVDVGVTPCQGTESLRHESLLARCFWESHWREEWCGIYDSGLEFYAPLTTAPCLELKWADIKAIRHIDDDSNPLSDYPLLAIETDWLCHYFAFADEGKRQHFLDNIEEEREKNLEMGGGPSDERFAHGFQTCIDEARSIGNGKWARISSGTKMKHRVVLNCRRMAFDLSEAVQDVAAYSEQLLTIALSLSVDASKDQPDLFARFLDAASYLKSISLEKLDPNAPETFCFFANLYHCLLQHALLFTVNGPLNKRSFRHFMRTSCYEIGEDVFSLAELYCLVLRGNMSRGQASRPPFMDAPRKSEIYRGYATTFRRAEINFILCTCDCSFPSSVPVLNSVELIDQLELQARFLLQKSVSLDDQRKLIILPKILDVYRSDFFGAAGCSNVEIVRYVLHYLDPMSQDIIRRWLVDDPNSIVIRYQFPSEKFYPHLGQESTSSSEEIEHKP